MWGGSMGKKGKRGTGTPGCLSDEIVQGRRQNFDGFNKREKTIISVG
jgi:hypothetical protein